MTGKIFLALYNGQPAERRHIPVLPMPSFREAILEKYAEGLRLASLFALPLTDAGYRLFAVLADDPRGTLLVTSTDVAAAYPALTPACPQAHLFEREICENYGIMPEGHPWLKPVRFPKTDGPVVGTMDFFTVAGSEIHEVAVGPVHAGVIEPGHFRFQCHGETVLNLEISLGYQNRGGRGRHPDRPPEQANPLHGDPCGGIRPSPIQRRTVRPSRALPAARSHTVPRSCGGIALELERLANHVGDLGALAGDVGYLPTALLLRTHPRRLPQHDGLPLRKPFRARIDPAGRGRL